MTKSPIEKKSGASVGRSFKVYDPTREERAFLYQQAQEAQIFFGEIGQVLAICKQDPKSNKFSVTFAGQNLPQELASYGEGDSLIEAGLEAKKDLFEKVKGAIGSLPDRDFVGPFPPGMFSIH